MSTFLDTSVLLAGLIDLGPQSAPAHSLLHDVAEDKLRPVLTAWHCCLEFFSVANNDCAPDDPSNQHFYADAPKIVFRSV